MGVFFLSGFRTLAPGKEAAGAGRCFREAPGLRGGGGGAVLGPPSGVPSPQCVLIAYLCCTCEL